jgi:very-short-patch-repair endonuclease
MRLDGEPVEIDLLWEEQGLAIESDGEETHGTPVAFQRDRRRDQLLGAAGYRVARVTWRQVEDETAAVVERIKRMLEQG